MLYNDGRVGLLELHPVDTLATDLSKIYFNIVTKRAPYSPKQSF
jgi:hypothetical protein